MNDLKFPYMLSDVYASSAQNRFNVISTFSGGGGSSLGYSLAGGCVLVANEFVEVAANTYSKNFPNTKILVEDIKKITGYELLDMADIGVGEIDILDGSPPCSAFSMNGSRDKGWNSTKSYSSGKKVENIEDLFYEFIRLADVIKPKIIIAENVLGLQYGEAGKKLNSFINEFEKIDYVVSYKTINAKDYGVCSSRPRTIIVCVRNDIFEQSNNIFPSNFFPEPLKIKRTVFDAFQNLTQTEEELDIIRKINPEHTILYKIVNAFPIKNDTNKIMGINVVDPTLTNNGKNFFNMRKLSLYTHSECLTTNISASGLIHPEENRKLSVKEYQRLMGLPDDYINTGTLKQQIERVGRMHAPFPLAYIADHIVREYLHK